MTDIERALELIAKIENRSSRGKNRIEITPADVVLLCDLYIGLECSEKETLRSCISSKTGLILIGFSSQFACHAIDEKSRDYLIYGLCLHVLEDFRFDPRENLRNLAFIYYAASVVGISFVELVESALVCAGDNAKARFSEFIKRPAELNKLSCFGVEVVEVDGKVKFVAI